MPPRAGLGASVIVAQSAPMHAVSMKSHKIVHSSAKKLSKPTWSQISYCRPGRYCAWPTARNRLWRKNCVKWSISAKRKSSSLTGSDIEPRKLRRMYRCHLTTSYQSKGGVVLWQWRIGFSLMWNWVVSRAGLVRSGLGLSKDFICRVFRPYIWNLPAIMATFVAPLLLKQSSWLNLIKIW